MTEEEIIIEIFYDKTKITKRLINGLYWIGFSIFAFVSFNFIGFGEAIGSGNWGRELLWLYYLAMIIYPFIYGTIAILRNGFRLLAKHPQVILKDKGIFLAEYKSWDFLDWNDIMDVEMDERPSLASRKMEPCIVLTLSEDLAKKVFDEEAAIKTFYLKISRERLFEEIKEIWEERRHS